MALGNSKQIIVGAAALYATTAEGEMAAATVPTSAAGYSTGSIKTLLDASEDFRNVGYTSNGLEIQFQPDFGEVQVDQVLDSAKLFKQGMQVSLVTSFAEATLENLVLAIAANPDDLSAGTLNLKAGTLGELPLERGLVAVGPGATSAIAGEETERIYAAYRALSIENVSVSAKRDEASMFEVTFRLLPNDNGSYGKIIDHTW